MRQILTPRLAGLVAGLIGLVPVSAAALDLSVAGVEVSLGGSSGGIEASVSVGEQAGVSAAVSGTGADVGVTAGPAAVSVSLGTDQPVLPDPDGPRGNPGKLTMPSREDVARARSMACPARGNSEAYNGALVFDCDGMAVGVVHSAWVGSDLSVRKLTLATVREFSNPAQCVTLSTANAQVGTGAIGLPFDRNALHRAIAGG